MTSKNIKIGIVGGSIAGCSAAILLLEQGYDVTVFERSNKPLVGRGGGIGTTTSLLEKIKNDGLIGNDFVQFHTSEMPFIGKTQSHEPYGRTAWSIPLDFKVFQWNELWKHLRKNVPSNRYKAGIKIVKANLNNDSKVELTTENNKREVFDLVLFADGYNSLGRQIIFPDKKLEYRGYILWRGLLPENKISNSCPLENKILRLSYQDKPGHNVVYYIPNSDGTSDKGNRVFNWAAYIAIPEDELNNLLTDKNGNIRQGTLPPGYMSSSTEKKLKHYLSQNIPDYYSEIVEKTLDSYIQVIYTLDLDNYHKDNICLIGDAGIVVQPFTGSGVFKGYNNAKDLIDCLKSKNTIEKALKLWNEKQLKTGKNLLALGEQMEKAFIWEQLDFAKVDEETTKTWWKDSVSFPENFNYSKNK